MECFSAILLFDAFSARKRNRVVHWITVTAVAFLNATLLNFAATTMPNYSKIVIVLALFFPCIGFYIPAMEYLACTFRLFSMRQYAVWITVGIRFCF